MQREPNSSVVNFEGTGKIPLPRNVNNWGKILSEDTLKKIAKSRLGLCFCSGKTSGQPYAPSNVHSPYRIDNHVELGKKLRASLKNPGE